jgi:hypothetical protein
VIEKFINNIVFKSKLSSLIFSLLFDALGLLSFVLPLIGEFSDIIWAPIASYLMLKMYPNRTGKIASVFVFLEELLPFVDVLPTFTLMWFYTNYFKKSA